MVLFFYYRRHLLSIQIVVDASNAQPGLSSIKAQLASGYSTTIDGLVYIVYLELWSSIERARRTRNLGVIPNTPRWTPGLKKTGQCFKLPKRERKKILPESERSEIQDVSTDHHKHHEKKMYIGLGPFC